MSFEVKTKHGESQCYSILDVQDVLMTAGVDDDAIDTALDFCEDAEIGEVFANGFEGFSITKVLLRRKKYGKGIWNTNKKPFVVSRSRRMRNRTGRYLERQRRAGLLVSGRQRRQ